jgi:outer membrane protein TolC
MKYKLPFTIVTLFLLTSIINAQPTITIGISKDANSTEFSEFYKYLKEEIVALTGSEYNVKFKELSANWNRSRITKNNQKLLNDPEVSLLIALGYISSADVAGLSTFPKPVIAANILDSDLQKQKLNSENATGINNYTYIESIIQLKKDIREFSKMFDFNNLVVLIPEALNENFPQLTLYLNQNNTNFEVSYISVADSSNMVLDQLTENTDAALILPLIGFPETEMVKLFTGLNKRHIPSLAVSGAAYLNLGATVTLSPEFTFQQLARQLALRVMKISEGINPSELSVLLENAQRVPIINMASIRATTKFPKWNILNESILINATKFPAGEELNIRMAIAGALENNLKGKMAQKDIEIAEKEVQIAKSNILPQVSVGGSTVWLSNNLVKASMGQRGAFTLTGSASLKQVIFSESAFANIAINKLLADNKNFYNDQALLDVVANISGTYIGLLFSKSNLLIQSENINATMQNLQMAKAKEEAGQSSISDVNRWVSELNLNKMKFNDAYTAYRSNMYQINQQLNTTIDNSINIPDSNSIDKTILLNQDLLTPIFENPVLTEKYASFIVEEMKVNSPEIQQLMVMLEIIERKNALYKRQWYMPEVALISGADQAFIRNGTIQPPNMPVPPPPDDMTFNLGINLKIPIFQGGKSSAEKKKSVIELDKINYQKQELINKLEAGIRTTVQKLRTSYLELDLSKNAAKAAEDNFKTVQDAYSQGAVNLIQLIDAQNVTARTKHMANIAYYQYVLDFIQVQRYQGKFIFLSSEEEQQDYTNRLRRLVLQGNTN